MKSWPGILLLSLMGLAVYPVYVVGDDEASSAAKETGWDSGGSLSLYYDSREYSTVSILTSIKGLPLGLDLWGFTDLHGDQDQPSRPSDFTRYFMEYRLSRAFNPDWVFGIKGLGFMAEFNDFNGSDNNLARFGPYYTMSIPLPWDQQARFQLRVFPYETDGKGWQGSMSYMVPFTDRFSLTGFADINFVENGEDEWVVEPQFNYQLDEHVALVLEVRYNGFEDANPDLDGFGVAGGLSLIF